MDKGFKIDFSYALYVFHKTNPKDLDDFCNNAAFGYFLNKENDSIKNRELYASILKSHLLRIRNNDDTDSK